MQYERKVKHLPSQKNSDKSMSEEQSLFHSPREEIILLGAWQKKIANG